MQKVPCPPTPAPNYPKAYPVQEVLANWNPDDTTIPSFHYDSFCRFDYIKDRAKVEAYREANVPVVIENIPEVKRAVQQWSDFDYLNDKLGPYVPYVTETSKNNHFMFARGKSLGQNLQVLLNGPTGMTMNTFEDWLYDAIIQHNLTLEQRTHKYFRVTSTSPEKHWLYDEFPMFKPGSSFFHSSKRYTVSQYLC